MRAVFLPTKFLIFFKCKSYTIRHFSCQNFMKIIDACKSGSSTQEDSKVAVFKTTSESHAVPFLKEAIRFQC